MSTPANALPITAATPHARDIATVSAIADAANAVIGARAAYAAALGLLAEAKRDLAVSSGALVGSMRRVPDADRALVTAQLKSLLHAAMPAREGRSLICCDFAVRTYCVCEASYACPVHGRKCFGGHE